MSAAEAHLAAVRAALCPRAAAQTHTLGRYGSGGGSDQALLLSFALPAFSRLLAGYNASLPDPGDRDRRLRVRAVVHCGNVHDDDNGCFGEALDIAFRLLDAPRLKEALKMAHGAMLLVVSSDIHDLPSSCSSGIAGRTAPRPVTVQVAGDDHRGRIHVPAETG